MISIFVVGAFAESENATFDKVLVLCLDRSGSMRSFGSELQSGVDTFLQERKQINEKNGTRTIYSVLTFDSKFEWPARREALNTHQPGVLKEYLEPRGSTSLNDAFAAAIKEADEMHEMIGERSESAKTEILVFTDGQENTSRKFTSADVREMVEVRERDQKYIFTFLAANQDAVLTGKVYGMKEERSMTLSGDLLCSEKAFRAAASLEEEEEVFSMEARRGSVDMADYTQYVQKYENTAQQRQEANSARSKAVQEIAGSEKKQVTVDYGDNQLKLDTEQNVQLLKEN